MRVTLFGATEVSVEGRRIGVRDFSGLKPRQVLEILALNFGHPLPKDQLAELLWDGSPPASWVTTLEGYVCLLRRAVEPGVSVRASRVITSAGSYQLDSARVTVDVVQIQRLVSRLAMGHAVEDSELDSALNLLRGDPLASETCAGWADDARDAIRPDIAALLTCAAHRAVAAGQLERGCRLAERVVEIDPFAEDAWGLRLECLWRRGRGAEALRAFAILEATLHEEIGVAPSPAIRCLVARIRGDVDARVALPEVDAGTMRDIHQRRVATQLTLHAARLLGVEADQIMPAHLELAVRGVLSDLSMLGLGSASEVRMVS